MRISLSLMRECEKGRAVADDLGDRSTTPTGEQYVVLSGLGGVDDARIAFAKYAEGRSGTLYWRSLPELREGPDGSMFWMRLFIG